MLYTLNIPTDDSVINGDYSYLFDAFSSYDPSSSVYSVFMFNDNDSVIIGSYLSDTSSNSSNTTGYIYNGSCLFVESNSNSNSDYVSICGDWDPRSRPWYNLSLNLNETERKWTDAYLFYGSTYGMSLVTQLTFSNKQFIFVVEYIMSSIDTFMNTLSIPMDGVLYLANEELSVIASTVGETDLIECNDSTSCEATNNLLTDSIDVIRDESGDNIDSSFKFGSSNENYATVTEFSMGWSMITTEIHAKYGAIAPTSVQYGLLVLAYTDSYLDDINEAFWLSVALSGTVIVLSIIVIFIIERAIYYVQESKLLQDTTYHQIQSKLIKLFASLRYNHTRQLILLSKICLGGTMVIIYCLLNYAVVESYERLVETVMVKEEYAQVYESLYFQIETNVDMIMSIMEEKLQNGDLPTYFDQTVGIADSSCKLYDDSSNCTSNSTSWNSAEKFLIDLMYSFTNDDGEFLQFGIYYATPAGDMYGPFQDSTNGSSNIEMVMRRMNYQTDWVTNDYLINKYGYSDDDELFYTKTWYDPRCM